MTPIRSASNMRAARLILGLAACLAACSVTAAEVLVTAEFKPNAADPTHNAFTNTTRPGFYCGYMPAQCNGRNLYMFDLPLTVRKVYVKGAPARQLWYMGFPPQRQVELRNDAGHLMTATIAFNAVSGQLTPGGNTNPAFTASPRGGCSYMTSNNAGSWLRFGWVTRSPTSPAACYSQGDGGAAGFTQTYTATTIGIGLIITTSSPLVLQNGVYEGESTFSLGGLGTDIDFGDDATPSADSVTMRFRFTVAHDLKVTTPAGGDTTRLQPSGGWANWYEHGIAPKALQSDYPFTITGSAPFSLRLDCEFPEGEQCAIRSNVDGQLAPVDIAISMPGIRSEASGRDANRYPLRANTGRETFRPTAPVAHRPSRLHFQVDGAPMQRMLAQPGSHWQGRATVIFDTEID